MDRARPERGAASGGDDPLYRTRLATGVLPGGCGVGAARLEAVTLPSLTHGIGTKGRTKQRSEVRQWNFAAEAYRVGLSAERQNVEDAARPAGIARPPTGTAWQRD